MLLPIEPAATEVIERNHELDIPLPKHPHVTLKTTDRPLVVIGDVHGCLEELRELIDTVHNIEPTCMLLFCGDLINKGPSSLETLRYVRNLCPMMALSVRGNHEDYVIDRWLKWQRSPGKQQRPIKKFAWSVDLREDEVQWLMELPYTISIPHASAIIVHAGLLPGIPLTSQKVWDMTEMRDIMCLETGELCAIKERNATAWASLWKGPKHVYFGHDAKRRLQQHPFATGLDTSCVRGCELTAMFLTGDKQLLHVTAKRAYKKKKCLLDEDNSVTVGMDDNRVL